jgi:aldose 1-epimerase
VIELSRGECSLIVIPEHGGSIVGWTRGGRHLLRHPSPASVLLGQPGAMGGFPLVPYCNRIAWRRFSWDGRAYELAANFGDHPHAIHGVGWQKPWHVEDISADAVTLSLRHDPIGESASGWPFAFAALLTYRLMDSGLIVDIEATNLHPSSAPMGIGIHPYFPRMPGAAIRFQADGVWINRDSLPASHEPVPHGWDFSQGRLADREPLDNCFTGWRGEATIPGMRIEADPVLHNFQVFTPAGADFFCVEPVSHVPDAINRPELPQAQAMTALQHGQTLRGSVKFLAEDN